MIGGRIRGGSPRRAPYPGDIKIGGQLLRLGYPSEQPGAKLVSTDQAPLLESGEHTWHDLSGGMGLKYQQGPDDKRYWIAYNVDCSIGGDIQPGPALSSFTPATLDATNGISHFFEVGGKLFALNGRYVHLRTSDNDWDTSRKDLGSGKVATDVIVHTQNTASPTTWAYIGMGDAEPIWKFDGTTYTQHAEATKIYARAWVLAGQELYRANDTNQVAKVDLDADPFVEANWSATNLYRIGDKTSGITRMAVNAAGFILFLKTDGIYGLDTDGNSFNLFETLKFTPDSSNGKYWFAYENWIHVTYSGRHFRIDPSNTLEPIGPERYTGGVNGTITAGIGTPFCAYAGVYDPNAVATYLFKFGAWPATSEGDPERVDAWHGALNDLNGTLASGATGRITAMHRSTIGAAAGHERLYIGTASGKIFWFTLPNVANPALDSSYSYDLSGSSFIRLPAWNGGQPNVKKYWRVGTATWNGTTPTNGNTLLYTAAHENAASTLRATFTPTSATDPGKQAALGAYGAVLWPNITFTYTVGTSPVRLRSLTVTYDTHPSLILTHEFLVLCENGLKLRNRTRMRIGADRIRAILRDWADGYTSPVATVILPTEDDYGVASSTLGSGLVVLGLSEATAWDDVTKQWRAAVRIRARTTSAEGTLGNL